MSNQHSEVFGHPKGLFVLFFTEMWERFSYYGMRAILVLYITASITGDNSGLGWEEGDALALYGWYTMLVYVMSIPGGLLADKLLGQRKTVMLGGLLLCAGHGILAIENIYAFYAGLLLIVLGVGGLKPNISSMVGGLYPAGDIRRDKGFTIFYIGINLGAFLASIIVGYVGETIGWHYGFGLAGIGMLIGQLVFVAGRKHLQGVGEAPSKEDRQNSEDRLGLLFKKLFSHKVPLVVFLLLLVFSLYVLVALSIGYGLLGMFLSLVVGLMIVIYQELTPIEKDRYVVLLISFVIVIVFWGAFEQAGGLLNIYTEAKVDRVVFGYEIPASIFQSVNALFIIMFGTAVAGFWARRKLKGKEASSLFKMAIGTIIMGIGFLFMAKASLEVLSGTQAALIWLILAYLFHTIGELSASPVALSFITKLAPARYVSIMMGVYFAATGLGNKVAGVIGESSQTEPIYAAISVNYDGISNFVPDSIRTNADNFDITGLAWIDPSGEIQFSNNEGTSSITGFVQLDQRNNAALKESLVGEEASPDNKKRVDISYENVTDRARMEKEEKGASDASLANYKGKVEVYDAVNKLELRTFIAITIFTAVFGLLLIMFLKRLKKLTHGVEELEK
jgi:proton-dependent oligopeptide transporter, POT family